MCGIAGYIGKNINFPTDLQTKMHKFDEKKRPDFQSYKKFNDKLKYLLCV